MKRSLCWLVVAMMLFCVIASGGCGGSSSGGGDSDSDSSKNYDPSILEGSWYASSGSGTATGPDGTFDLRMTFARASFSNVQSRNNSVSAVVSASAEWDAYQNGFYIRTIPLSYSNEAIEIQRVSGNTWRYTFPSSQSKITVKITSETSAAVVEEGNFRLGSYLYQYKASYTISKQ